ncbi:MAG: hypothetical protein IKQ31_03205 [Clostridia bacterium]|nr:hypothetical protein [Clostridia bacterium]
MKFFKKFASFAICAGFVGCSIFGLSACSNSELTQEGPSATDFVVGNGGLAVQKGDYLYFVNGYVEQDGMEKATQEKDIVHSAIYRIKLTDGKVTEAAKEKDKDGNEIDNGSQKLEKLCKVVSKVSGFKYSNLYIFGDYLYYSTPNTRVPGKNEETTDNSGNLLDHIDFYRVKLDGSHEQRIYSCSSTNENTQVAMFNFGDKYYQVVKDGDKLVLTVNNGKVVNATISEKVNEVAFPKTSEDEGFDINQYVLYSEDIDEDGTGTQIVAYDLNSGNKTVIVGGVDQTYKLFGISGNCLYYTYQNSQSVGAYIYCLDYNEARENSKFVSTQVSDMVYSTTITAFVPASSDYQGSFFYTDGSNTYYRQVSLNASVKYDFSKDKKIASSNILSNVVSVQDNKIYYNDSGLKYVDFMVDNPTSVSAITEDSPLNSDVSDFDVDGSKIFYLVQHNDNYYLHYTNTVKLDAQDSTKPYHHFVGELLEADYDKQESESD